MSICERVICFGGAGNEPKVWEHLPELLLPFGLQADMWPLDHANNDYEEQIGAAEEHLRVLSEKEVKTYLLGWSAGSTAVYDLMGRAGECVEHSLVVAGKTSPYDPKSRGWQRLGNLVAASERVLSCVDQLQANGQAPKITRAHSRSDERVDAEDMKLAGTRECVIQVDGHIEGMLRLLDIDEGIFVTNALLRGRPLPASNNFCIIDPESTEI